MIYIILEEISCEDTYYDKYESIMYTTTNKELAYEYFNKCCGETDYDKERFILREYENASENYCKEIFKIKDTSKYEEECIKKAKEEKLKAKELKAQYKELEFNLDF